jgi:hypothetical protein
MAALFRPNSVMKNKDEHLPLLLVRGTVLVQALKQNGNDARTGRRPGTNWPVGPVRTRIPARYLLGKTLLAARPGDLGNRAIKLRSFASIFCLQKDRG